MPIQGTAADILKRAMIDVHARSADRWRAVAADDPHGARRTAVRGARGAGRRSGRRSSASRWSAPSRSTCRSTSMSGSARTGRRRSRPTAALACSTCSLNALPLGESSPGSAPALGSPLRSELRRAFGDDRLDDEPIEVGAQRRAAIVARASRAPSRRARRRQRPLEVATGPRGRAPASSRRRVDPGSRAISSVIRSSTRS